MSPSRILAIASLAALALAVASVTPAYAVNYTSDAGTDIIADRGDTVTLDGSWTFGTPDQVQPLSVAWSQRLANSGVYDAPLPGANLTRVDIQDANQLVATFTTPVATNLSTETLVFVLAATFPNANYDPNCDSANSGQPNYDATCDRTSGSYSNTGETNPPRDQATRVARDHVSVFLRPMHVLDAGANNLTQTLIDGLAYGTTLHLNSETKSFTNETFLKINKPMTLKGPGLITGNVAIIVTNSNVEIDGVTFRDITSSWRQPAVVLLNENRTYNLPLLENIVVENNTIENTSRHGILLWTPGGSEFKNIKISSNTLIDIGRNEALPNPGDTRNGSLMTAIRFLPSTGATVEGLDITDNYIKNPSFAGINLGNGMLTDTHISGNTIEDMLAFAIQKASRPARDYTGETVYIYDNEIKGANNNYINNELKFRYPKVFNDNGSVGYDFTTGAEEQVVEAAIIVWGGDNRHIKIYDNTIRESHNGVLICQGGCGVHEDFLGTVIDEYQIDVQHIDHAIDVYNNSFMSNAGDDVINLTPSTLVAGYNYWGDSSGPYTSLAERVQGRINYLPAYSDPQLQNLRLISSDVTGDPALSACSATGSAVSFGIVTGGESAVVRQSVTNVGNQALQELQLRVNPWTDSAGNEYATLTTSVKVGGAFVELEPGAFVSLGSFLPASGTSSDLEFKVAHSGRVLPTGDDSLSQVITLFASCG